VLKHWDRNLEAKVGGATTCQIQGCNARRSNHDDVFVVDSFDVGDQDQGIIQICLSGASWIVNIEQSLVALSCH
jgi:hypothetical protein